MESATALTSPSIDLNDDLLSVETQYFERREYGKMFNLIQRSKF